MPRTLLIAGEGTGRRRTLDRALAHGLHVVTPQDDAGTAAGRAASARPGRSAAEALVDLAARHGAGGLLAASRNAVPATLAAASELGLAGAGAASAAALGSRIALRRQLADAGVAQPRFAAVRTVHEGHVGLATVGLPAVLKPAEPRRRSAVHVLDSGDDLDARLYLALADSENEEAMVERFHDGPEVEVACVVRDGLVAVVAVVDRTDPAGSTRAYPSALFGDVLEEAAEAARHALHALALADGVASVQVVTGPGSPLVLDVGLWTPEDPLDALVRHAVGVDLLELAIRVALGVEVPEPLARARFHRPAALRVLAPDDPTPSTDDVAEAGPGYLVVEAATNLEALERASAAG